MIIFINVFTVHSEKQLDTLQSIQNVYVDVVKQQPDFVSAQLLRSEDGICVTAIAHWESRADLQAMRTTPAFKELHNQQFYESIISNEGHVYSTAIDIEKH